MSFKSFQVRMAAQLVAMLTVLATANYLYFHRQVLLAPLLLMGLWLFQIGWLWRLVSRVNLDLERFLSALDSGDSMGLRFVPQWSDASFQRLYAQFNRHLSRQEKHRAEREQQKQLLQIAVDHLPLGLLCIAADSAKPIFINRSAHLMTGLQLHQEIQSLQSQVLLQLLDFAKKPPRQTLDLLAQGEHLHLAARVADFQLEGRQYRLVCLQDIGRELELKETEAWQNLIRVMTHEMMNSITPISTLAFSIREILEDENAWQDAQARAEALGDMVRAVYTIEARATGLLHFVETYRELRKLPQPKMEYFPLADMFDRVKTFFDARLEEQRISFRLEVSPGDLNVCADAGLLEQVLINLVQNAIQALENRKEPRIAMIGGRDPGGRVFIDVHDNGPGISPGQLTQIFIPFYTTKDSGSGIGLSLSKHIMQLHGGNLTVKTDCQGGGTTFRVRL